MMRNRTGFLAAVLIVVVGLAACGGGGGGGGGVGPVPQNPSTPSWAGTPLVKSSLTASPIMTFRQSVPSNDHTGPFDEIFPGQANAWYLEPDFAVVDGFDLQFGITGALAMTIDSGGSSTPFPVDQTYSELSFYSPLMGEADGVKVAAASDGATVLSSLPSSTQIKSVITGTYAAFLNATSDSQLQQTLDLTSLPTGTTIRLTWQDAVSLYSGDLDPDVSPTYSVVLRAQDGTFLSRLFGPFYQTNQNTASAGLLQSHSTTLLQPYAGQKVVLSFEINGSTLQTSKTPGNIGESYAIVDQVSVKDYSNSEVQGAVENGGFETGALAPYWIPNTPSIVQNVTSGKRTNLEGLNVTRSFYTVPKKLWARWVDVFENPSGSPISRTIIYDTELGSAGFGVIYDPVSLPTGTTATPKALSSWDSTYYNYAHLGGTVADGTRDVGLVFGNADSVYYVSDDGNGFGDPLIEVSYNITVPAGGMVAIVNFVLMDGTDTGYTAVIADPLSDTTANAVEIDAEAKNILAHFWDDPQHQYVQGMTEAQVSAVINFSH